MKMEINQYAIFRKIIKLLTFVEEDINAYEGWVRQNMLQNPIVRQIQDEKKFEHIYVL